jgi:hypothetical protein
VANLGQVLLESDTAAPYCDRSSDRPFGQPKVKASLGIQRRFKISDAIYRSVVLFVISINFVHDCSEHYLQP